MIGGWVLDELLNLDDQLPGVLAHCHRSSDERFQVMCFALALRGAAPTALANADMAALLTRASHRAILEATIDPVPPGLRRALGRSGKRPHARRFYRYLSLILTTGDAADRKAVARLNELSLSRLRILRSLDPGLRDARLVSAIPNAEFAKDIEVAVRLLSRQRLDRGLLAERLRSASERQEIAGLLRRWAFRADLPKHPVPPTSWYAPIETGADLRRTALTYRNCMRTYIGPALAGRVAFAAAEDGNSRAVVHLRFNDAVWTLEGVYGPRNQSVPPGLAHRIGDHLAAHEVRLPRKTPRRSDEWRSLERLMGFGYEWDDEEFV